LEQGDLRAVAVLYAELDRVDPSGPLSGYMDFFGRVLLTEPELTDPELPSYVYEDADRGVVGVIGSHPRRYVFGERRLRLVCGGPLIVHPDFRSSGVGALLLRRFAGGDQVMTFNDRSIEEVHAMWRVLGAATDGLTTIEWSRVLAPGGYATRQLARRVTGYGAPPAEATITRLGKRLRPVKLRPPREGHSEPFDNGEFIELVERLGRQYSLRPDYTPGYLDALFSLMGETVLGNSVVRRLVRAAGNRPIGAYVMIVAPHGTAHVLNVVTSYQHADLVMEHLFHDAAVLGAVEATGRCEMVIQAALAKARCRLHQGQWTLVQSADSELVNQALSAKAIVSRMEGEWWMRPRPHLVQAG
jgi:GNAT superfamily N-acetyltransferase